MDPVGATNLSAASGPTAGAGGVTAAPTSTAAPGAPPHFEVKKWSAVALWAWDIQVDKCAICRNQIMGEPLPLAIMSPSNFTRISRLTHARLPGARPMHRVPVAPGGSDGEGVHRGLGSVQPRVPLPLHPPMASNTAGVSSRQQGVGVSKVWEMSVVNHLCVEDLTARTRSHLWPEGHPRSPLRYRQRRHHHLFRAKQG